MARKIHRALRIYLTEPPLVSIRRREAELSIILIPVNSWREQVETREAARFVLVKRDRQPTSAQLHIGGAATMRAVDRRYQTIGIVRDVSVRAASGS